MTESMRRHVGTKYLNALTLNSSGVFMPWKQKEKHNSHLSLIPKCEDAGLPCVFLSTQCLPFTASSQFGSSERCLCVSFAKELKQRGDETY